MHANPVAKVYARALFEMGRDIAAREEILEELNAVCEALESSGLLSQVFASYNVVPEKKLQIMDELSKKIGVRKEVQRFASLLVQRNRIRELEDITDSFEAMVDEELGVVRGTVTTVEALSESEREGLSKAFAKKFNKQVILEPVLDKAILGGLVVNVQGLTFDGSLRTTIHQLKDNLERQSV